MNHKNVEFGGALANFTSFKHVAHVCLDSVHLNTGTTLEQLPPGSNQWIRTLAYVGRS